MTLQVLPLKIVRTLELDHASSRRCFSAASGMWVENDRLYVVADDALELGVFDLQSGKPGRGLRILHGALPDDPAQRKKLKPDFESLTRVPDSHRYPHGALLAFGSGSTQQRKRAMAWAFASPGQLAEAPELFSLQALYEPLEAQFADLNIEGLVIQGNKLMLWQRGNNLNPQSSLIEYRLDEVFRLLDQQPGAAQALQPLHIEHYALGRVEGVPLTFTDACALEDGGYLFTAAAENTEDSYRDGECVGAAIGLIGPDRQLKGMWPVEPAHKIEGISAKRANDGRLRILLVTDADDPQTPALLLETWLSI